MQILVPMTDHWIRFLWRCKSKQFFGNRECFLHCVDIPQKGCDSTPLHLGIVDESLCGTSKTTSYGERPKEAKVTILLTFSFGILWTNAFHARLRLVYLTMKLFSCRDWSVRGVNPSLRVRHRVTVFRWGTVAISDLFGPSRAYSYWWEDLLAFINPHGAELELKVGHCNVYWLRDRGLWKYGATSIDIAEFGS